MKLPSLNLLRLQFFSCFSRVDWQAEAVHAYAVDDWDAFLYCFKNRETQSEPTIMNRPPFFLAFESGDPDVVRKIVKLGADVNATITFWTSEKFTDDVRKKIDKYNKGSLDSYHELMPITSLMAAHELDMIVPYRELLDEVSDKTRARTLWWALATRQETWAKSLQPENLVPIQEKIFSDFEDRKFISFHYAAIFGDCSLEMFQEIWRHTTPSAKKAEHIFAPGYGHDNDPVYAGNALYWAEKLGRKKIADFLKGGP